MDIIKTRLSNDIEVQHTFHAKGKGETYTIYLRFYILFKTVRTYETTVSTGITVAREKWTQNGSIKGSGIVAQMKNEKLREQLDVVRDGLYEIKRLKIANLSTVKYEIENGLKLKLTNKPRKGEKEKYLSKIGEHNISAVKDSYIATIPDRSTTYKKNFRLAVQRFVEWWSMNYGTETPKVSEVTTKDMKLFKTWFEKQKGIKHNTISTYMNRLRTIFNHAVSEKLIAESPIPKRGLIEDYKKGEQVRLTTDEMIRIKNIPDHQLSESMKRVKYIFLFLCSTAMGYGELKSLRLEHIEKKGEDFIISKERNKTGVMFYLPLSETAKHIYTNYFNQGGATLEPFANLPSIEYVTRKVKVLATMAGIDKNLTTYVGRRTFATQWATDGNNIYFLSMILGHTDIRRTYAYIDLSKSQMIDYGREAFKRNAFHTIN